jgi:hypothetical protein
MTAKVSKLSLIRIQKIMKTNQTITFNFPKYGIKYEITCPLFFVKLQEVIGLDVKPLFAKMLRSKIENLENLQELNALTKQGQFDLENYKIAEQILTSG